MENTLTFEQSKPGVVSSMPWLGRVLVACEYSGIVRDAFAARGWDAWSCDLLPSEKPGNHYQGDVRGEEPQGEPQVRISDGLAIKSLEQLIDSAAENLPPDWKIRIEVQREYGEVIVTRPDGSECPMSDGENDMREQFRDSLCLIRDELEADRLLASNAPDQVRRASDSKQP